MHPRAIAEAAPDRPAIVMAASGAVTTFAELDARSNQFAQFLRSRGIGHGGSVAIFAENHPTFLEVTWGAQRAGLFYTAVNSHLNADEAGYIVNDCDASVFVSSRQLAAVAAEIDSTRAPNVTSRLLLGGELDGWERYEDVVPTFPTTPVADEAEGDFMLYSSGTTGRPKGIKRTLSLAPLGSRPSGAIGLASALGLSDGGTYLCPAPLYHSAPLAWSMSAHRLGCTVVVMERFEPETCLQLIERYHVTNVQFVPTMFVRLLKLPDEVRHRYDLSSLKGIVHAAAPCPADVKREMIEWLGPIVYEYYSATEGMGATFINSEEALAKPGSVGRAMVGTIHVLDEDGKELGPNEIGTISFSGGPTFEYHKDPVKTAEAIDTEGRGTVGDVGYVDEDGYLFLTDRKAFMIISGGVNIYPQEAENVLVTHPKVLDVGVIGVPHPEMGEEVKAVVQPMNWNDAGAALEEELLEHCRAHLAAYKCPRSIDFVDQLPRLDTGKLYKQELRKRYWS
ncbi:MAG TPA: AMP-binding protein [Acidimicrobiales bacterium]|jgi:acyl-CoA synthetase (AMP-forming)/AMP-acid ligase II|nr:AMP-binding protein [Acidimicrobiales bacterium]